MKKLSLKLLLAIFFIVLVVAAFVQFNFFNTQNENYKTERVAKGNLESEVNIPGEVKSGNEATMSFLSSGRIEWVGFREGDEVEKDDVIASLKEAAVNKDGKQTGSQYQAVTIVAPFKGIISQMKGVNVGQNVSPASQTSVTVISDEYYFSASVDETEISNLKVGQTGKIVLDAYPGKVLNAEIYSIGNSTVKTSSGGTVIPIRISMMPTDTNLMNGLSGEASFKSIVRENILFIPRLAVRKENGNNYVYVLENKKAVKKNITVGQSVGNKTEIVEGLNEGEDVILGDVNQ